MRSEEKTEGGGNKDEVGGEGSYICSGSKVCDGTNNCGGWEDEPERGCGVDECAEENGGCDQVTCAPLPQLTFLVLDLSGHHPRHCINLSCIKSMWTVPYLPPTLDLCGHPQELPLQLPTGLEASGPHKVCR